MDIASYSLQIVNKQTETCTYMIIRKYHTESIITHLIYRRVLRVKLGYTGIYRLCHFH